MKTENQCLEKMESVTDEIVKLSERIDPEDEKSDAQLELQMRIVGMASTMLALSWVLDCEEVARQALAPMLALGRAAEAAEKIGGKK